MKDFFLTRIASDRLAMIIWVLANSYNPPTGDGMAHYIRNASRMLRLPVGTSPEEEVYQALLEQKKEHCYLSFETWFAQFAQRYTYSPLMTQTRVYAQEKNLFSIGMGDGWTVEVHVSVARLLNSMGIEYSHDYNEVS